MNNRYILHLKIRSEWSHSTNTDDWWEEKNASVCDRQWYGIFLPSGSLTFLSSPKKKKIGKLKILAIYVNDER